MSLGLLPSAEGTYQVAVEALKEEGGWLHVHGNVKVGEKEEVRKYLRRSEQDGAAIYIFNNVLN